MPSQINTDIQRILSNGSYHPMDYWDSTFPEIANYVRNSVYRSVVTDGVKKTIVKAEVKSGKRLVAQSSAAYTNGVDIINVFISAYVRKADFRQRKTLEAYMLGGVFTVNT